MIVQRALSGLSALLLATGIVQGVRGGWIHVKAGVAQILLHGSWERTQAGGVEEKPWPWADTWPVARLTLPGSGEHIVLAGATGRNLAFAPGHLDGSSEPGGDGTCVIAGHRDTHFSDLDRLELPELDRLSRSLHVDRQTLIADGIAGIEDPDYRRFFETLLPLPFTRIVFY